MHSHKSRLQHYQVVVEEALRWTDSSTNNGFGGNRVFQAWSTKSQILQKLGKQDESKKVMQYALSFGTVNEVPQYARQLLGLKLSNEAFAVFKMNHDKNHNQFTTLVGLARGDIQRSVILKMH